MKEGKWIKFVDKSANYKNKTTQTFDVVNKEREFTIGQVRWHGPFRQYSFFPVFNTVYERQCLMDIAKFLHHLMLERKMKKEIQK